MRIASVILIAILLPAGRAARAQDEAPGGVRMPRLTAGAGAGLTLKHYTEGTFSYDRIGGAAAYARIAWRIRDFFGLAIEGGWMRIASTHAHVDGEPSGDAALSLTSIPVSLAVHLRFPRFTIDPGIALNIVTTRIDAFGERSSATHADLTYTLAAAWLFPLSDRIALAPGITLSYIPDLGLLAAVPRVGIETTLVNPD